MIGPSEHDCRRPSLLRRSISTSILIICLFVRITLPYLRYFLALAYRYERTHQITEKVAAASMSTANSLGKRSIELAALAIDNRLIMEAVTYCVEGFCGGLNDGLGQVMKAIEARHEP